MERERLEKELNSKDQDDADTQLEKALGGGLDELDEEEEETDEEEEDEASGSRKAFKTADREERVVQRQRALIEASKMRDEGGVHTAEELQSEVESDYAHLDGDRRKKPCGETDRSTRLRRKEGEDEEDKKKQKKEGIAGGGGPLSMQEYLDGGFKLVFNTPYRVDEMLRLKGLKDGLDLSTSTTPEEDETDVGDQEDEDEEDIFK